MIVTCPHPFNRCFDARNGSMLDCGPISFSLSSFKMIAQERGLLQFLMDFSGKVEQISMGVILFRSFAVSFGPRGLAA